MPDYKKFARFLLLLLVAIGITSCLTCERKEYVFQLTGENSGKLTIKYVNIFSSLIDSTGELSADYEELMNLWMDGEKIERDFPMATRFKKKLYEENGTLCGEVVMEFDDLSKVHLYRYLDQGPFMFSMSGVTDDNEVFHQSNGDFGGDRMPVVFWPDDAHTLRLITRIATPDSTCVSMLPMWKNNN